MPDFKAGQRSAPRSSASWACRYLLSKPICLTSTGSKIPGWPVGPGAGPAEIAKVAQRPTRPGSGSRRGKGGHAATLLPVKRAQQRTAPAMSRTKLTSGRGSQYSRYCRSEHNRLFGQIRCGLVVMSWATQQPG